MEKMTIKSLGQALKGEFRVERQLPEPIRQALQALAATHERADASDIQTAPGTTRRVAVDK